MASALLLPPGVRPALLLPRLPLLLLASCMTQPPGPPGESHSVQFDWPTHGVPQLDLLFVVDDTTAMEPYRDRAIALGPYAAFALESYTAGEPDLHVAVARTSGGPLTTITDVHNNDGSRRTSYRGSLADALTAMLDVGSTSTTTPQPLATIERAIADTDFARPDTNLMTVTITSSDDHSLESVDHYVAGLKSRPRGAIATGVYAQPAPRLDAFHSAFDAWGHGYVDPLDGAQYGGRAFSPITDIVIDFFEPCFEDPIPEPAECTVSMFDESDNETVLPACDATSPGPCWVVAHDSICNAQTIDVRGYLRIYRPRVVGECVTH